MNPIYPDNHFITGAPWYILFTVWAYQFDTYIDKNLHKFYGYGDKRSIPISLLYLFTYIPCTFYMCNEWYSTA